MLAGAKILIVAPDAGFRQSLGFLLEAEGASVAMAERLADSAALAGFDCIVIDRSTARRNGLQEDLAALGTPVVQLVNRLHDLAAADSVRLVEKPLLGSTLVDAVRCAIGRDEASEPAV